MEGPGEGALAMRVGGCGGASFTLQLSQLAARLLGVGRFDLFEDGEGLLQMLLRQGDVALVFV